MMKSHVTAYPQRILYVENRIGHGGAAEMAQHSRTALLFRPGDQPSRAESIRRLYLEPDLRSHLGQTARKKALATFSVAKHARNVQAIYEKALSDKGID